MDVTQGRNILPGKTCCSDTDKYYFTHFCYLCVLVGFALLHRHFSLLLPTQLADSGDDGREIFFNFLLAGLCEGCWKRFWWNGKETV